MVVNPRRRIRADRSLEVGEEVDPSEIPLDRPAGDDLDFVADDTKVMQLAVRKATQLGNRLAINAPVTIVADQVHCRSLFGNLFGPFAVRRIRPPCERRRECRCG